MKKISLPLLMLCAGSPFAFAADVYWDSNGITPGAAATPTGTWGTSSFWSPDATGAVATAAWLSGDTAVFSAGSDAIGAYTVTLSGTQTAAGLVIQEGAVTLGGSGAVALGASSNIVVNAGANLITDSSLRITVPTGSTGTATLNGGTLTTTNPSSAGTFLDADLGIVLGPAGGTIANANTTGVLNIIQTGTKITGPGSLTKTGPGIIAVASAAGNNTYAGATIILDGELRIRTVANTLPVTTAVAVSSPGILNLNGVSQQIGSLSGAGRVGTGGATLTVGDAANSSFTGVIENYASAGGGVTTGAGKLTKVGAGTLTLSGISTYTGATTITAGTLALTLTGSIANSPTIDVQTAGTLDVAGVTGGFSVATGQTLKGNGSVIGPVAVLGTLAPGASPGTITMNNSLTFGSASTLALEIGGTTAGQFDQVNGITNLTLDGTINVTLFGAFDPAPGNSFDVLNWSGTLNSAGFNLATDLVLPALTGGKAWDTSAFLGTGALSVVPETPVPSLVMGSLAMLGMARRRRA